MRFDKASPTEWGIVPRYRDNAGVDVDADGEVIARVLAAMRADSEEPDRTPMLFLYPGESVPVTEPCELHTEDGTVLPLRDVLPPDLPYGYHTIRQIRDGTETALIVSPTHCFLPSELHTWGWALQLYSLRSQRSWGIGDLCDLDRFAKWSQHQLGAGAILVSPLHAPLPLLPQEPSPYYPSSRRFRNPLHIGIEGVPGAASLGARLEPLAAAGRDLNRLQLIDRDRAFAIKMQALEYLFEAFIDDGEFERYRTEQGEGLEQYATFCALAERHRGSWRNWPTALRHPRNHAVRSFRARNDARVQFHQWLQWLLDRQLAQAGAEIGLIQDLAIGVRADGADAWTWQDVFLDGVNVGAPPDQFNQDGQDWGVPPFDPWRLRAARYRPFIETVRAAMRWSSGLRIDHAMGLFRLFWIPHDVSPRRGVYVRYPYRELLDILCLESHRASGFVVGEALGTVEPFVLAELARRSVLSYRLLAFGSTSPDMFPRESVAALTTHDLPTFAGIWNGTTGDSVGRGRLLQRTGLDGSESIEEAAERAHRVLSGSASRLVLASVEDAIGVTEPPNKPGIADWPNWSLGLPMTLEQLMADMRPKRIAVSLRR